MPDGHLQLFQWQDSTWTMVDDLLTTPYGDCFYPLACGRNAVCSANQQCTCPGMVDAYFKPVNNQQPNLGCSEITPLTCNATHDQDFIPLANIDYSTFTATLETVSVEACKQACLNNCSCKAALFRYGLNASPGDCSLPSDLFTITSVEINRLPYNASAFIKVQNVTSPPSSTSQTPLVSTPRTPSRKNQVATVLRPTIASIVVLVVVVSGVIMFIVHKRKRNAEMEEEYFDQCFSKKLGEGGFGEVFEGTLEDGSNIAVKRLDGRAHVKKSFLAEVESIGSIHHVNLVTLKGFCALKSQPLLVYEFMSNGSLDRWIYHGHRELVLEWECRKKIILDVAKGLAYLHEDCRQKIIHLDIKPQNILLDDDFNAKIADFGLAKLVNRNQTQVMTNMRGTPGYLAPEWLSSVITEKVDVYSFGIVLLEVLCGRKIFDISQPEESRHLLVLFQTSLEEGKLLDIIDNHSEDMQGHGPEVVEMMNVASWCLQADFTRRPSMSSVVKVFEGVTQIESNLNYSFIDPRTTLKDEIVPMACSKSGYDLFAATPVIVILTVNKRHLQQIRCVCIMRTPWILISSFWFLICSTIAELPLANHSANLSTTWINENNIYGNNSIVFSDSSRIIPVLIKEIDPKTQYFVCGFFCNGTCTSYIFSMFIISYDRLDILRQSQVIWFANEDHPIRQGAILNLTAAGDLVLQDVDGTKVWTTNTTGKSVAGIILTRTGNLVLFNAHNSVVWQSFDHPKDCLLPGQTLFQGQKLISRVSPTNWTKGLYSLQVTNEGLFAYVESNPPQVYYQLFTINNPTTRNEKRTYLRFLNGSFDLFSSQGEQIVGTYLPRSSSAQYMKLMPDGHLQLFQWQDYWTVMRDVFTNGYGDCYYPLACGRNAVCSANRQCSCPRSNISGVIVDYFTPLNNRHPDLGCSEITPLTCNATQNQDFILLEKVDYSTFTATLENVNVEACKQACLNNCSCKAALFYKPNASFGKCCLPSELFTIMSADIGQLTYNLSAFIKVQNVRKPQTHNRKNRVATVLRPTIASIVVLVVVVSGVIMFIVHKQKRNAEMEEEYLGQVPGMPTRFSYEELKIATKCFSKKLGEGGFGSVFEGTLEDGSNIAVKRLEGPAQVMKSFLAEVESIGSIHHVNLVTLKGFCALKSQPLLVYEFMSNGSLDRWIYHGYREHVLEWECRKKIILDVAKGLAYLHEECRQKIIHLDIKPQNILLDSDFNAKIADFGLSKLVDRNQTQGNPGYLAPEWLSSVITEKVDVYSFGIVVLEILCARKNFDISQPEENRHLLVVFQKHWEQEKLLDIIDKYSEDMQAHGQEVVEMMNVASWCLQADFTRRPSMSSVVKVFEGVTQVESNLNYSFIDPRTTVKDEIALTQLQPSILSAPRGSKAKVKWVVMKINEFNTWSRPALSNNRDQDLGSNDSTNEF
ncbi:hypothetical protein OSB04_018600 [Centaurea solstitialis]|uniref:non-specific serine/threonine protein kinase n=1 Tax=Centaurea solstitialis TaxID=347529 RepID=A0AA38WJG9_9ASTR|nr:hypothetical protein OSB04_018600 [Centaurea solstitialis]